MRMAPQRFAWRFHPIKENRLQPNALIKENKTFLLGLRENLWILRARSSTNGNIKLPLYYPSIAQNKA